MALCMLVWQDSRVSADLWIFGSSLRTIRCALEWTISPSATTKASLLTHLTQKVRITLILTRPLAPRVVPSIIIVTLLRGTVLITRLEERRKSIPKIRIGTETGRRILITQSSFLPLPGTLIMVLLRVLEVFPLIYNCNP